MCSETNAEESILLTWPDVELLLPVKLKTCQVKSISLRKLSSLRRARLNPPPIARVGGRGQSRDAERTHLLPARLSLSLYCEAYLHTAADLQ